MSAHPSGGWGACTVVLSGVLGCAGRDSAHEQKPVVRTVESPPTPHPRPSCPLPPPPAPLTRPPPPPHLCELLVLPQRVGVEVRVLAVAVVLLGGNLLLLALPATREGVRGWWFHTRAPTQPRPDQPPPSGPARPEAEPVRWEAIPHHQLGPPLPSPSPQRPFPLWYSDIPRAPSPSSAAAHLSGGPSTACSTSAVLRSSCDRVTHSSMRRLTGGRGKGGAGRGGQGSDAMARRADALYGSGSSQGVCGSGYGVRVEGRCLAAAAAAARHTGCRGPGQGAAPSSAAYVDGNLQEHGSGLRIRRHDVRARPCSQSSFAAASTNPYSLALPHPPVWTGERMEPTRHAVGLLPKRCAPTPVASDVSPTLYPSTPRLVANCNALRRP